jgi:hypothetical protein
MLSSCGPPPLGNRGNGGWFRNTPFARQIFPRNRFRSLFRLLCGGEQGTFEE